MALPGLSAVSSPTLRARVSRHRSLLTNAASLFATTGVTALSGVAFWWVAAHRLPLASVGYASAAVSAMTLIATVGMLGFGTMLIAEAGRVPGRSGGLITAALLAAGAVSGAGALLVVGTAGLAGGFIPSARSVGGAGWLVVGAALISVGFVLDQALVGLLAGGVQLARNTVFSLAKLGAVALVAGVWGPRYGVGVLAAWVLGAAVSLLVLAPILWRRRLGVVGRPDWVALYRLRRVTASHSVLNLATQATRLALPVLVTALLSATTGAVFYVAWMVAQLVYLLPGHLATVLFAIGAGETEVLADKLRVTLTVSVALGAVVTTAVAVFAHPLLAVFGPSYAADATWPLRLLLIGFLPMVVKVHYVAVVRVQRRLTLGAAVTAGGTLAELGGAIAGGLAGGLDGLCLGLLVVLVVEALVCAPTVALAAIHRARRPVIPGPSPAPGSTGRRRDGGRHATTTPTSPPASRPPIVTGSCRTTPPP